MRAHCGGIASPQSSACVVFTVRPRTFHVETTIGLALWLCWLHLALRGLASTRLAPQEVLFPLGACMHRRDDAHFWERHTQTPVLLVNVHTDAPWFFSFLNVNHRTSLGAPFHHRRRPIRAKSRPLEACLSCGKRCVPFFLWMGTRGLYTAGPTGGSSSWVGPGTEGPGTDGVHGHAPEKERIREGRQRQGPRQGSREGTGLARDGHLPQNGPDLESAQLAGSPEKGRSPIETLRTERKSREQALIFGLWSGCCWSGLNSTTSYESCSTHACQVTDRSSRRDVF